MITSDFEAIRTLVTRPRFTIIEARDKKLELLVILKKCEYSTEAEAEFFIRSFLWKTKNKHYSHPPLSIRAEVDQATGKKYIIFEWKKGKSMDQEIEVDQELQLASGNAGYEKREMIHMNASTGESVERAKCLSLNRKVVIKAFRHVNMEEMNPSFEEALAFAKCTHPNVCEFLDFRLFQSGSGDPCAYIVMERLEQDLGLEMRKRKSASQPYTEKELLSILIDVTAGLLHAKSMNIAHRDLKPANILRGPQGFKLVDFGSAWQKGQYSETANAKGTVPYMSPEAWVTMNSSTLLQRPFESDVFSLGVTMLHLATFEMPLRSAIQSEQEALLRRAIIGLSYSDEFKQILTTMLSFDPLSRPTLELIRENALKIFQIELQSRPSQESLSATETSPQKSLAPTEPNSRDLIIEQREQANKLFQQAKSKMIEKNYAEAIELCSAADAVYSRLCPNEKDTALNLNYWGVSLGEMGLREEAVRKHAAADEKYSRLFPNGKDTAHNLMNWGVSLGIMKNCEEAARKFAAADAIYSRFFPDDKDTANNLKYWGMSLGNMKNYQEAVQKFATADAIYSRLFPNDEDTAFNLYSWGLRLNSIGNWDESTRKHAAADAIYSRLFPNDKDTARNLHFWALCLGKMGQMEEAVRKHAAADAIFSRFFPNDKDTALNLEKWGVSLNLVNDNKEAVKKYAAADATFSRFFPNDKETALNLNYWGMSLSLMNNEQEAVRKYAAADAIFSRFFASDKDTALNLKKWGVSLGKMGQRKEAVRKFQAASGIYTSLGLIDDARDCDKRLV